MSLDKKSGPIIGDIVNMAGQRQAARRRRKAKPVPTLHLVMIRISCAVAAIGGMGYYFAPADKASFFRDISLIALSFLFGKATNGFGVKDITGQDDEEATEGQQGQ